MMKVMIPELGVFRWIGDEGETSGHFLIDQILLRTARRLIGLSLQLKEARLAQKVPSRPVVTLAVLLLQTALRR
jgi:hypothetical protein